MIKSKLYLFLAACLVFTNTCAAERTHISAYPSYKVTTLSPKRTALSIEETDFSLKNELENYGVKRWEKKLGRVAVSALTFFPPDSPLKEKEKLEQLNQKFSVDTYLVGKITEKQSEERTGYYTDREPVYGFGGFYGRRRPVYYREVRVPYTYTVYKHTYTFDLKDTKTGKILWHAIVATEGSDVERMGKAILNQMVEKLVKSGVVAKAVLNHP